MHTHIRMHAHTHTYTITYNAFTHTYVHMHICTYMYTHTHTHTHTHTPRHYPLCLFAGQLFPDSDPKWKGARSDIFLKEAVSAYTATWVKYLSAMQHVV